jgi:hypothetical protein
MLTYFSVFVVYVFGYSFFEIFIPYTKTEYYPEIYFNEYNEFPNYKIVIISVFQSIFLNSVLEEWYWRLFCRKIYSKLEDQIYNSIEQ